MAPLDTLLTALRARRPDMPLDQLEPLVWRRIEAQQPTAPGGSFRWRTGFAALMLGLGMAAGGAAASSAAPEASPFAVHVAHAPSTLLEGSP